MGQFSNSNLTCSRESDPSELKDQDSDIIFDTNEELPLRKPQSAYVLFGNNVSDTMYEHELNLIF